MSMKTKERASENSTWLQVSVILILAVVYWPEPGLAWGDHGHKLVNAAAVDNLPESMRAYFQARKP